MSSQGLGELIHTLQPSIKKLVRDFERRSFKLCKQKISVLFNQTCLNEDILPKYTNIYKIYKILSRGGSRAILDIKESIMIGRLNPTLNERESSSPLCLYE